ncbi:MAG: filamentous hemagglutinin N-terminal domain-containing protein, partial [Methylococcales bacterium]
MLNIRLIPCVLILVCCQNSWSEVTLDGSLGQSGALSGPNFQITENLGHRVGSNLFHSFGSFNLTRAESATFSGSSGINNVISRVTGGSPSSINGALRSTIPNANLYFLNP